MKVGGLFHFASLSVFCNVTNHQVGEVGKGDQNDIERRLLLFIYRKKLLQTFGQVEFTNLLYLDMVKYGKEVVNSN